MWNHKDYQLANNVLRENWCPSQILAVKVQQFTTKHGSAPIQNAASTSKSVTVTCTLTSQSPTEPRTHLGPANILTVQNHRDFGSLN